MTMKVTRGKGFVPVKPLGEDEGQETGLLNWMPHTLLYVV